MTLRWDLAVAAGVVTELEAAALRQCVEVDDADRWHVNATGLTDDQCKTLQRAIRWFCVTQPA